jgi:hypothetical protein
MLKIIAIGIIAVIAAIMIYATTRPDTFRVQRSTLIKASPERILAEINDFHRWAAWSPWEKKDPKMKRIYSGPASGIGTKYGWDGNKDIGSGSMEIIGSTTQKTSIKLDFFKPFEAHNTAEFTVMPKGDSSEITWSMDGPVPYFGKIIHLFFNMDKMVGGDFETGLANLKTISEKPAAK